MKEFLIWILVLTVVQSVPIYVIAKKMESDHAFLAFFPLLQFILLLELDNKSWYWILLTIIPFAGLVLQAFLFANIAEKLGKPVWMGACTIIPVLGFVLMYYIAFFEDPDAGHPDLLEDLKRG